ncbi:hypothetical protein CEXT_746861 [Caerostris extrusa]|uniref:Uncharacterized protein n=1 Tax=Caerostris extrusa TaxID=172846 RepID=A0AAV4WQM4_CAEEX|nr:hypothetical protein CEXT_746861 [Caerostris extrusa]
MRKTAFRSLYTMSRFSPIWMQFLGEAKERLSMDNRLHDILVPFSEFGHNVEIHRSGEDASGGNVAPSRQRTLPPETPLAFETPERNALHSLRAWFIRKWCFKFPPSSVCRCFCVGGAVTFLIPDKVS